VPVTLSPYALTTLEEAKEWLRLSPAEVDQDQFVVRLINRATGMIETLADRRLKRRAYVNDLTSFAPDGSNTDTIWLMEFPVASVQQVLIDGGLLAATEYQAYPEGYIRLREILASSRATPGAIPEGVGNVRVDYTAGYDVIPDDLAQVAVELVSHLYQRSGAGGQSRAGIRGRAVGDKSESFSEDELVPTSIQRVIARYARLDLISHRPGSAATLL
jgi:hypothetical protein